MKVFTFETQPKLIQKDYARPLKQHLHTAMSGYQFEIAPANAELTNLINKSASEGVMIDNLVVKFGSDGYRILISCHSGSSEIEDMIWKRRGYSCKFDPDLVQDFIGWLRQRKPGRYGEPMDREADGVKGNGMAATGDF